MNEKLSLFDGKRIRKVWKDEKWYFSVIDVIEALTDSVNPRDYWFKMKQRASSEEKVELSTICRQLKLVASDGKKYNTDCSDTEGILRVIQSIPSPKAEPFKRWLAQVGSERIEEINNPELAADRMKAIYEAKEYSKTWIEQREKGIISRHNLTDEWKERGVSNRNDFAILTNEIYKSGFGMDAKNYKKYKNIHESQNLRDSMTNIELALTNLGEVSAVEIHRSNDSRKFEELKDDSKEAGEVIDSAIKTLKSKTGKKVISKANYKDLTKKEEKVLN